LLVSDAIEKRSEDAKKFQASRAAERVDRIRLPDVDHGDAREDDGKDRSVHEGMKLAHPNPITVCL